MQSYTSASSRRSTPSTISPVRSLYSSSFSCANCAAVVVSAGPAAPVRAVPLPFIAPPAGLLWLVTESTGADADRVAESLAWSALFSCWACAKVDLSLAIVTWASWREAAVVARSARKTLDSAARVRWVASSLRWAAMRSFAAAWC